MALRHLQAARRALTELSEAPGKLSVKMTNGLGVGLDPSGGKLVVILGAAGIMAGSLTIASPASACATCGCGDPTLTSMGSEKPFAGRLRTGLGVSAREDVMGDPGVDELELSEQRLDLQVAWAPTSWLFLQGNLPFFRRETRDATWAKAETIGLGDLELRAKFFVYKDRAMPRHLIAVTPGVTIPLSSMKEDAQGQPLPMEAQPTLGTFAGLLGVSYAHFFQPFSVYFSVNASYPIGESEGHHEVGASLRGTAALQHQALDWFAWRLGPDVRLDQRSAHHGMDDPHSGGAILFVSPELLVKPVTDWLLSVGASVPVLNELNGRHEESIVWRASVAADW